MMPTSMVDRQSQMLVKNVISANMASRIVRPCWLTSLAAPSGACRPRRRQGSRMAAQQHDARDPVPTRKRNSLELIAAYVETTDRITRWETAAGRAAMIGFAAAFVAESLLPSHGLFGSWNGEQLTQFGQLALVAVCGSGLLAAASTRRVGAPIKEAVYTSLTALSRSASSISRLDVDSAVDAVLDSIFDRNMVANLLNEDEWI